MKTRKDNALCILLTVVLCAIVFIGCPENGSTTQGAGQGDNMTTEEESDFVLTIWAEEPALTVDELYNNWGFVINTELKNQSGQDVEIIVHILFWPYIQNWQRSGSLSHHHAPFVLLVPNNGAIRREPAWTRPPFDEPHEFIRLIVGVEGSWGDGTNNVNMMTLPVGTHEVRVAARFGLRNELPDDLPLRLPMSTGYTHTVWSNTIEITVLPSEQ